MKSSRTWSFQVRQYLSILSSQETFCTIPNRKKKLCLNLDSVLGIGQYTIVDQGTVTLSDIGSNFFLDQDSLGKSRAQQACELLDELNEDVQGHWVAKDIVSLLEENPNYLSDFTLVIATAVTPKVAEKMAGLCWKASQDGGKQISFVWVKTVGLIGAARIAVPEHAGKRYADFFFPFSFVKVLVINMFIFL